jgi:DNA-binding response OmpR family regulator
MDSLPRTVLIVSGNPAFAERILNCIAGNYAIVATDFAEAKAEFDRQMPDLVISEVRLGEFNGLHLAFRAAARGLANRTLLVGEPDRVLEADAVEAQARYLARPLDDETLQATITEMLSAVHPLFVDTSLMRAGADAFHHLH